MQGDYMEFLKAILFGIIEGITEWLPISSTGHMILLNEFINLNVSDEFYKLFEVVIQLGAIMAVVVLYFKTIFPWGFGKSKKETKDTLNLWGKIIVACLPAAVIGILLDDWLDAHLYNGVTVSLTLIIYGIIFIVIESKNIGKRNIKDLNDISYKQALGVGGFQLLSLIPGTSRSGSTIIGGLLLGLERSVASTFTFFLAIPVMAGASLLKLAKYVMDVGFVFETSELIILLIGCVVSFVISMLVIKYFMAYIKKHDFKVFGYYRIILGLIVLGYFVLQML
jgi:undecaprenyl-diphosphatase